MGISHFTGGNTALGQSLAERQAIERGSEQRQDELERGALGCTLCGGMAGPSVHRTPSGEERCAQCLAMTDGPADGYTAAMGRGTLTIWTVADRDGTLVDSGYRAGDRVVIAQRGLPDGEGIVIDASPRPYEYVHVDRRWERSIRCAPALRIAVRTGVVLSYPVAWLQRVNAASEVA